MSRSMRNEWTQKILTRVESDYRKLFENKFRFYSMVTLASALYFFNFTRVSLNQFCWHTIYIRAVEFGDKFLILTRLRLKRSFRITRILKMYITY